MILEHPIYTIAFILIIGIFYTKYTGRKYLWWVILFASIVPDLDHLNNVLWKLNLVEYPIPVTPAWYYSGIFHTIFWLIIFSVLIAWILTYKKIDFVDALIACIIGYTIHLFEDYIAYPPSYSMLYPFSTAPIGINIIPETNDLGWMGLDVLQVGGVFLLIALILYALSNMFCRNAPVSEDE